MQASIIIPHYNDVVRLQKCLGALVPQIVDGMVEIVVADNASTDDISGVKVAFPQVRFVHAPDPGAAAARNRAVAEARGAWLFFTDADCVPTGNWVETALRLMACKAADTAIIGGCVTVFDETPPPRSGAEAFETVFAFPQEVYVTKKNYSVTANMLTTRAVFDHVGPFDGSRVEDMDWGHRVHALGYKIRYAPELVVAHPTRKDWPALLKKWRRITAENFFANGTGPRQRLIWGLRSLAILGSIPVHALVIFQHGSLSVREKARALGVLASLRLFRASWTIRQAIFGEKPINVGSLRAPKQTGNR